MGVNRKRAKFYIYYILICAFLFVSVSNKVLAAPSVSAQKAILMDQETGRILYEKDAHTQSRIASITKIMTAILAVESGKMDQEVTVSSNAAGTEGSSLYLKAGEKIKLEDLVYGLMLRSGNDGAVAIAEFVGGSLDGFVYMMNEKAKGIGMENTHFSNPHGLDDHEDHYSTAYDMAVLARYSMENDKYKEIAGTKVHTAPNPDEKWDRKWKNKNRLLTELYKYSTGGKTGYTKLAKRTLVSTASKDGENLIAVTLNGPDDWNDHIGMFEYGFKHYDYKIVLDKGRIEKMDDKVYKDHAYLKRESVLTLTDDEVKEVKVEYKMLKPKEEWIKGEHVPEVVGKAVVYLGDEEVDTLPVFYKASAQKKEEKSWWKFWAYSFESIIGVRDHG
ncbi:D-alanyl-D-alanine carboxypeptidase family protein [Rossellomorea vietnamensis]|uniref:D-alanyl-D-alanine carboxypeptidase n=1 Tax=Rossellomorea vietnamensis TaxID=218284 RepID=A0A0P6W3M6_9BACI|nr:D-alanyl-D-alanine carboxypeptidase family protein [Rossellomorea vietnamensis]KPL59728.1 D-alanyl-D-alanine carboxypeptidase [Rossellomorea vietnamensis]